MHRGCARRRVRANDASCPLPDRAENARGRAADRGAQVIEADAYDAIPAAPDIDVCRKTDRIDVVLFTSASARLI